MCKHKKKSRVIAILKKNSSPDRGRELIKKGAKSFYFFANLLKLNPQKQAFRVHFWMVWFFFWNVLRLNTKITHVPYRGHLNFFSLWCQMKSSRVEKGHFSPCTRIFPFKKKYHLGSLFYIFLQLVSLQT